MPALLKKEATRYTASVRSSDYYELYLISKEALADYRNGYALRGAVRVFVVDLERYFMPQLCCAESIVQQKLLSLTNARTIKI